MTISVEDLILADLLDEWAARGGPRDAAVAAGVIRGSNSHDAVVRVAAEALTIIAEKAVDPS